MAAKPRIGFFSFTGDEGCLTTFAELLNTKHAEWLPKVNLVHCRFLKSKNVLKDLDVAFVEGAISTKHEEKELREIRKNCKRLVALGSCATTGSPSNHRNFFDKKTLNEIRPTLVKFEYLDKVYPLSKFVRVDDFVPGCPMDERKFAELFEKLVGGA